MASELHMRSVVHYQPIRISFAQSTRSRKPALKKRPCVVVEVTKMGITITPLCRAQKISSTEWGRREGDVEWGWLILSLRPDLPLRWCKSVLFDGIAVTRDPLIVTHEPSLPKLEFYVGPKPSYIWVGDNREWIPPDEALTLGRNDPYTSMSTKEIEKIKEKWQYCTWISYCVFYSMFFAA
ncbi:hypothetical protein HETIRDRAFT_318834 [Heterobasidion irregulare TC 32-1]|uniref:Uncharacterized protein n=1 Tax=Heterobasidion irregulare (strain TC 32-1) TaxID=747525 RepID=W4K8D9_HETIT|nr:uncharacterized protein HETIRDRAFT_318834 [Heterobasidion irregulare TC 32-1]ETW81311.1 hypothetical protein HETIRDRAFT_318834 [Heterobasidion irregulare TC 32-1]